MLRFKTGVLISGLQPEMLRALDQATETYSDYGHDCIVTSARGDRHSNHSHHYKGLAVDLRTRHLTQDEKIDISADLERLLGAEFQVILETTHIHIEYDPKQL